MKSNQEKVTISGIRAYFRRIGDSLRCGYDVDQFFEKHIDSMDDLKQLLASEEFEVIEVSEGQNDILTKIAIYSENEDYNNVWVRLDEKGDDLLITEISFRAIGADNTGSNDNSQSEKQQRLRAMIVDPITKERAVYPFDLETC